MKYLGFLTFFILILYFLIIYAYFYDAKLSFKSNQQTSKKSKKSSCDVKSCGSIDPVSDPKYNMQQIVKQSILLEEHLANKNKRCRDCITKHFLHIIGLAEEAQMLATNKIDQYKLINECVEMYNRLFQKWLKKYDAEGEMNALYCCDELRTMRKKLIAVYFFNDENEI
jgi:hypothetical protein